MLSIVWLTNRSVSSVFEYTQDVYTTLSKLERRRNKHTTNQPTESGKDWMNVQNYAHIIRAVRRHRCSCAVPAVGKVGTFQVWWWGGVRFHVAQADVARLGIVILKAKPVAIVGLARGFAGIE